LFAAARDDDRTLLMDYQATYLLVSK